MVDECVVDAARTTFARVNGGRVGAAGGVLPALQPTHRWLLPPSAFRSRRGPPAVHVSAEN